MVPYHLCVILPIFWYVLSDSKLSVVIYEWHYFDKHGNRMAIVKVFSLIWSALSGFVSGNTSIKEALCNNDRLFTNRIIHYGIVCSVVRCTL